MRRTPAILQWHTVRRILKTRWLLPTLGLWIVAAAIPPETIVNRFLPSEYDQYRPALVQGLWLLKCMLVVDGLLWIGLPLAGRLFGNSQTEPRATQPQAGDPTPRYGLDWLLLAAITTLALAVRLYHVGDGFGYDEIFVSTSVYQRNLPGLIARAETHRLFYALWAWTAYQVAGPSETAARLPALLFGVASVPALFLCVRGLVGRREGLLAAMLLAASTFHVWYSQEATSYTMALFFAILSTAGFYRCVSTDAAGPWLTWTITAFLTIFSHFFVGLMLLFGQALFGGWLVVRGAADAKAAARFLISAVYALAAFFTVTSITFFSYLDALSEAGGLEARGELGANLRFLGQWTAGTYAAPWWQVFYGTAAICGAVVVARRDPRLTLYLALPSLAILVMFVSGIMGFITPRYCILALIPSTVFVATAVVAVADVVAAAARGTPSRVLQMGAYAVALAVLLYGAGGSLREYFSHERYPFRPVADYLAANPTPDEQLLFGGYGFDKFRHYAPRFVPIGDYGRLRDAMDAKRPFWLVYYMPSYHANMPEDLRERLTPPRATLALHYQGFPDQLITQFEGYVWHVGQAAGEPRTAYRAAQ